MYRWIFVVFLFWGNVSGGVYAQPIHRILFIPLDDRPPCLQFPEKMGLIGRIELVSPPRELLGKFTDVGKSEEIIAWLDKQDLRLFDAAIISVDMIAYGGLVGSRVPKVTLDQAKNRLTIVERLRKKAPTLTLFGSSVIMRLAPTADGSREAYREKTAKWAEISLDPAETEHVQKLENEIPLDVRQEYQKTRQRNHEINQLALHWVAKGIFDYLILSQDDAKPRGMHVQERERLVEWVKAQNLGSRVAIQPGADEVSMLLLGRFLSQKRGYRPKIQVVFSDTRMAKQAMPYEDRALHQTVSFHILATGAVEVQDPAQADLIFYVFTSRHEKGRALSFAQVIAQGQSHRKVGIIVADIDPIGDLQGGDSVFTEALGKQGILPTLFGYACWNTAGNTLGTALPHGLMYGYSVQYRLFKKSNNPHQRWFMQNRLLDDYAYHSLVRPKALAEIRRKGWSAFKLQPDQRDEIQAYCLQNLEQLISQKPDWVLTPVRNVSLTLPWDRTFEAEIDFQIP